MNEFTGHRLLLLLLPILAFGCTAETGIDDSGGEVSFVTGRPVHPEQIAALAPIAVGGTAGGAADPLAPGVAPTSTDVDPAADPAASPGDPAAIPGDPAQTQPVADATAMPTTTAAAGTLTVSFTSKAPGGRYNPRNVGAVWVETSAGAFVKTLERWAATRASDLRAWNAASGGWGFSFFGFGATSPDQVDVVSAATLSRHQAHRATWTMKNVDGVVVPDGGYVVVVEVADDLNQVGSAPFEKGPTPVNATGPDTGAYTGMTIDYTP